MAGAVASAVALSLVVSLFPEPGERAKALGVFGLATAGGGSIGVLLGGVLTGLLSWHWIFLVNVPIGVVVLIASLRVLPATAASAGRARLDVPGAVLVTAAVMLAVYSITDASHAGWTSARTGGELVGAAVLLAATSDVPVSESGLASGIANTSFMLGGALGLAVLASLATTRTANLLATGHTHLAALTGGYHAAYLAGAASAALGALACAAWLRPASLPAESATAPTAERALIAAPGDEGA